MGKNRWAALGILGLAPCASALQLDVGTLWTGERTELVASGADPGEQVRFVRGTGVGAGTCPGALGGACLAVTGTPSVLGTAVADPTGVATLGLTVPANVAPGTRLGLQAVAIRGVGGVDTVLSDAVGRTIPAPCAGYRVPGDYATLEAASIALTAVGGTICLGSGEFDTFAVLEPLAEMAVIGVSPDDTHIGTLEIRQGGVEPVTVRGIEADAIELSSPSLPVVLEHLRILPDHVSHGIYVFSGTDVVIDGVDVDCGGFGAGIRVVGTDAVVIQNSFVHGCAVDGGIDLSGMTLFGTWSLFNNTIVDSVVGIDADTSQGTFDYANNVVAGNTTGIDLHTSFGTTVVHENNAFFDNTANYAGTALAGPGYVTSDCGLDDAVPPAPARASGCVDGGSPASAPPTDFSGAPRDALPDIGAVERR